MASLGNNYPLTAGVFTLARLWVTAIAIQIGAWIIDLILPLGGVGAVIGGVVSLGGAGYWWSRNWPPWPPRGLIDLRDLIDEIETEHRTPTPADAAEAISLLGTDAGKFGAKSRKRLAEIIGQGMEGASDAARVLTQVNRIEGGEFGTIDEAEIVDRLFDLYDAAEPHVPYKIWEWVKYPLLRDLNIIDDQQLWRVEDAVIMGTTIGISRMAQIGPIDDTHREKLVSMGDSDRREERACAAITLGAIGRDYPEHFAEAFEEVLPLANDREKIVRESALLGLAHLGLSESEHRDRAREKLAEIAAEGPDPDIQRNATELLETIQEVDSMDEELAEDMMDTMEAGSDDGGVTTFEPTA